MPESLPGEIIGVFAGIAICLPLLYQIKSQLVTPTKSPLPAYCWWLWASGWLGLALLFSFVPRAPDGKQIMDSPESPRTLGYFSFISCFLCQLCWALDGVSPAFPASRKTKSVVQRFAPTLVATVLLSAGIRLVYGHIIKSRPFYRRFLANVAFVLVALHVIGSIVAPLRLSTSSISRGGPEVAGLHWLPTIMQMLGLFTAIFTCTLVYTNPEWFGIVLLSIMLAADAAYIGIGRLRLYRERTGYGPVQS